MFWVVPFRGEGDLFEALAHPKWRRIEEDRAAPFASHAQVKYLSRYISILGCKTIVIEDPYVDREFLEDFAAYYVRCHEDYGRRCRRLHFFRADFDESALSRGFRESPTSGLAAREYLGSVIAKPLAVGFIGRTTLAPPPSGDGIRTIIPSDAQLSTIETPPDEDLRYFPTLRPYTAHVGGADLQVESLAFQEQDTAVAACATTAIWSSLHKAGKLFDVRVPSPAQITGSAGFDLQGLNRMMPSDGLSGGQICRAIRETGLEVEVVSPAHDRKEWREPTKVTVGNEEREVELRIVEQTQLDDLRGPLYAYLRYGVPVVLGLELPVYKGQKRPEPAGHAVAVAGFKFSKGATGGFRMSDRMTALYVHDDQTGPFVEAKFAKSAVARFPEDNLELRYRGSILEIQSEAPITAVIAALYAPIDPWIRIKYRDAWQVVLALNKELLKDLAGGRYRCEWDMRLSDVAQLLRDVSSTRALDGRAELREHLLRTKDWPKYMWRATAHLDGKPIMELIMDCTDSNRAFYVEDLVVFDHDAIAHLASAHAQGQVSPLGSDWVRLVRDVLDRESRQASVKPWSEALTTLR